MLSADPECAVRDGRVLVPRMQKVDSAEKPAKQQPVRPYGAVLITGGVSGFGALVARWLASAHGVWDLVLTSRRGMRSLEAEALVHDLAMLGAKSTVISGDVANLESVESVMGMFTEHRPLRGVIHAAGVPDAGVLATLTPERCATTFAPKVDGACNLHQLTTGLDLDLFVVVSSISGVMGMPGLGLYAAANAFLDAPVHVRRSTNAPATSVAFGPLSEGMAAGLVGTTRAHLAQFGLNPLTPDKSLELLERAMRDSRALTVPTALDLDRLGKYVTERGGIPPLLRSLLRQGRTQALEGRELHSTLRQTAPAKRMDILLRTLRETVATSLGFELPDDVPISRPLRDIGVDSLTAILVRNQLATLTGLKLSANIVFTHPSLEALGWSLLFQLEVNWADASSGKPDASTMLPDTSRLSEARILKGLIDDSITFENAAGSLSRPEVVLVTGATGFVGALIVHELLHQGIITYCLVRASHINHARQRMVDTLTSYGCWESDYENLLVPVVGDIAKLQLGLTDQVFDDLASRIDAICHAGALVEWMRPLDDYLGPNMVSTHENLRLASRGRGKAIHLVSTVATLPRHQGYEVSEEDAEYCYATSKWIAERMLAAARFRGAKASVYRLPFVTASAATGYFRLDRGDFLHNLIVGSIEMGSFPSLGADLSIVLPVDYLCRTVVNVVTRDLSRIGLDFDFVNSKARSFDDYFKMMAALGADQAIIPFPSWRQKAPAYAITHPTSPIARIATILDSCCDDTVAAMFEGPRVGQHVFDAGESPVHLVDDQYVQMYLNRIELALEDTTTGE